MNLNNENSALVQLHVVLLREMIANDSEGSPDGSSSTYITDDYIWDLNCRSRADKDIRPRPEFRLLTGGLSGLFIFQVVGLLGKIIEGVHSISHNI